MISLTDRELSKIGSKKLSKIIVNDYDKYRQRYYSIAYGGEQTKEFDRDLIEYVIKWLRRNSK